MYKKGVKNVNVNGGLPFRIAIAWSATPDSNSSNYNLIRNKYSITISKPGVSGSTITYQQLRNLHQEITLTPAMISNYGTGTYTVTIRCLEYNVVNDVVGLAWNNINPLGYAPFNAQ